MTAPFGFRDARIAVSKKCGLPSKVCETVIRAYLAEILANLAIGRTVNITKFCTITFTVRKAHAKAVFTKFEDGVPKRGTFWCPEKLLLRFIPSKFMKEAVISANLKIYDKEAHITKEQKRNGHKAVPGKQITTRQLRTWWGEFNK